MNQVLLQFSYLQVLDFLTTVAFLVNGVQEGNPVVKTAFAVFDNPMLGLIAIKVLAVLLAVYCWRVGRRALLTRMNLLFALLVAWNLVALIIPTTGHA